VELKDVIQAFRRGWWLLVIGLLLGVSVGGVYTWQATPLYTSTTQLFVSTTATQNSATAYQGDLFSQQRVTSYVEILTGERLAGRVVEQLGLDVTPAQVAGTISALVIPKTVLLEVSVTRESPTEARDIAAAVGQQFTQLVTELETPDAAAAPTVKVAVLEEPGVPQVPTSPYPVRNIALGAIAGLVLAAAVALLRERMDNTVKTPEDLEELTGVAVVGALAEDPTLADTVLFNEENGYSETAEAYRQIRTNLQFLDVDRPAHTIVVTSSLPGEGKTTVAVNLALVLAESGARVALIEGDLRRPRVTRYLGMISGAGLANVLAGTVRYDQVVQPVGNGRLSVLAAGPMPPNPSEMLGSGQMRLLLDEMRQENDYVLIDAPPLLPVTDAAVLSVAADGALLVARHGVTTRAQLHRASEALHRIDAKLLGVILNRIPPKAAEGYGYGYQYAYDAAPAMDAEETTQRGRQPVIDHTVMFPAIRDEAPAQRVRR
jgi:succinoglycan biosynthesis transport protein ExoP